MSNGRKTLTERMIVIETKFETVIEPMAKKVDQLYKDLRPIVNVMPEQRETDGNGGYKERRTKKTWREQFKETPIVKKWAFVIVAIPFVGAYWEWLFTKAHDFLNWIEALPK